MDNFSITSGLNQDVIVATISGRVDSVTAATLDKELEKIMRGNKKVVLDLNGVVYLSSAGVRAIIKMLRNEQKSGGNVKLASMPRVVEDVLEIAGMLERLQTYPTVEEAVASF
jgi:anti-anti-sigma factor